MHLVITITTYNRPESCLNLLNQIYMWCVPGNFNLDVLVADDNSDKDYSQIEALIISKDHTYHKYDRNHGKKEHWKIASDVIQWASKKITKNGYYFYLQDDLILNDWFFHECINIFETINDPLKVVLNPCLDSRTGKIWTPVFPTTVKHGKYDLIKVGWVDLRFMASPRFFFIISSIFSINSKRWEENPNLSSGVGKQISQRLVKYNAGIYQTTFSLYDHGSLESLMNPESRKLNNLKSI